MLTSKQLSQNIEQYLTYHRLTANKVLTEAGLGKNTIDNMKKGSMPSVDKVLTIAEYLGVSVDFLLGRTPIPDVNSEYKGKAPDGISIRSVIIERVKSLSDHQAELLLAFLEGLVSE